MLKTNTWSKPEASQFNFNGLCKSDNTEIVAELFWFRRRFFLLKNEYIIIPCLNLEMHMGQREPIALNDQGIR